LPRARNLDAVLLEDRTPLVVKGMEIKPVATNRFKKTDNVIMYSEIYEPLLVGENPPKVVFGYNLLDRATNQQIMTLGASRPKSSFTKEARWYRSVCG